MSEQDKTVDSIMQACCVKSGMELRQAIKAAVEGLDGAADALDSQPSAFQYKRSMGNEWLDLTLTALTSIGGTLVYLRASSQPTDGGVRNG